MLCEEWNVHINTVRPQKPKQMVFGIVSVCSMASMAHGELPIAATQNDNIKKAHKQITETTVIILARFSAEDKVSKLTKHERDGKTKSKMNKKKCNGWRARDVYATCCPCSLPSPHSPSVLHHTIRSDSDWIRIVHAFHSRFYANFDIMRFALRFSRVHWMLTFVCCFVSFYLPLTVLPCFNNMCLVPHFFLCILDFSLCFFRFFTIKCFIC